MTTPDSTIKGELNALARTGWDKEDFKQQLLQYLATGSFDGQGSQSIIVPPSIKL